MPQWDTVRQAPLPRLPKSSWPLSLLERNQLLTQGCVQLSPWVSAVPKVSCLPGGLPAPVAQINIWASPAAASPSPACALAAALPVPPLWGQCGQPAHGDVGDHAASVSRPDSVNALNVPFAPSSASITKTGLFRNVSYLLRVGSRLRTVLCAPHIGMGTCSAKTEIPLWQTSVLSPQFPAQHLLLSRGAAENPKG